MAQERRKRKEPSYNYSITLILLFINFILLLSSFSLDAKAAYAGVPTDALFRITAEMLVAVIAIIWGFKTHDLKFMWISMAMVVAFIIIGAVSFGRIS